MEYCRGLVELANFSVKLLLTKYMFALNSTIEYSLLFLGYLKGKEDYVSLKEVAEKLSLPRRFLARLAATLAHRGVVVSKEGKSGGYKLGKKADKLTLFDFFQIIENKKYLVKCANKNFSCKHIGFCKHRQFFLNLSKVFKKEFSKYKLSDVLKSYA